jgi:hypothetical protein
MLATKPMKASAVKKTDPAARQLVVFMKTLGITKKTEIYMYGEYAYINADLITPVLSVSTNWLKKNAEHMVHYIIIKKKVFVNKYGLTKLLAQSREAVAFQLQDYIYEVIYKLETDSVVIKDDVVTRKTLVKTLDELDLYKMLNIKHELIVQQTQEECGNLRADHAVILNDYTNIKQKYDELLIENKDLECGYQKVLSISKKIAKHIRNSGCAQPLELTSIDISDDEFVDHRRMAREALIAKKKLRHIKKNTTKNILTTGDKPSPPNTSEYFLMRSINPIFTPDGNAIYTWRVDPKLPNNNKPLTVGLQNYDNFKTFSEDCCLGDILQIDFDYIWRQDVYLTEQYSIILSSLISYIEYADENFITKIIKLFL